MKYCVTVTNHGVHEFDLDAGAPDTGGQNVFVNQMSRGLVDLGWDVTIFNRGGYPHPRTGVLRRGTIPAPAPYDGALRTVLLEDGVQTFIRKEEMGGRIETLAVALTAHLREMIERDRVPSLIVSHYWDGGCIAISACRNIWPDGDGPVHAWIPHSLGTVKRRNIPREQRPKLRLDEREEHERRLLADAELSLVGSTSAVIERALTEDYGYNGTIEFLPPCVDAGKYFPGNGSVELETALLLERFGTLPAERISGMRILTEISRTDRTKRKDIVVEAFSRLARDWPDILLAITIDSRQEDIAAELLQQIERSGVEERVVVLGNVAPHVPALLRSSYLYITPSEMEGFGMSIQEAAACGVPAVSSDLVPFAVEYLGSTGAWVVPHGDTDSFVRATESLLRDDKLRGRMGRAARAITVPAFTWPRTLKQFLNACNVDDEKTRPIAQLSPDRAEALLVAGEPGNIARERLEELAAEYAPDEYRPEGRYVIDPRDGTKILYNTARAQRPHDNRPPSDRGSHPATGASDNKACVVCSGNTTPIIDIAPLSCGFTFINYNLYPMVVSSKGGAGGTERTARGLHLLQWTSSIHDQDWHTLSSPDRLTVVQRLAAMEKRLVASDRYVTIVKNYGRLVGGSLAHGHQQIAATNILPARFERNRRYRDETGKTVSGTLSSLVQECRLELRRFSTGTLGVTAWMRRPYEMVYTVHDDRPEYLFQLTRAQMQDLGDALGIAIAAMMDLFPRLGKEPAYNIVFNTGPGAGIFLEFLPYTQEIGGFEHAGLYVCQSTPEFCYNTYASDILPGQWQ